MFTKQIKEGSELERLAEQAAQGNDSVGQGFCGNQRVHTTKIYFHSLPREGDSVVLYRTATSCMLK